MSDKNKKKGGSYSALMGFRRAVPIILTAIAVFFALCFITQDTGIFGKAVSKLFLGLFSIGGYFIPFLLLLHAFFYASDVYKKRLLSRSVFSFIVLIMISTITHTIKYFKIEYIFSISEFFKNGTELIGGGAVGGIFSYGLTWIFGNVGLIIIAILIFALYITYFFSGGKAVLSKLLLKLLTAISDFFTRKGDKKKRKLAAKEEKSQKRKSRVLAIKQNDLLDDEFFAADNGMKEFEIPELGIHEVRSDSELESNPVLQDKVFHKSTSNGEHTAPRKESASYTEAEAPKRRFNMEYNTYDSIHGFSISVDDSANIKRDDDIIYDSPKGSNNRYGLDRDAEDVFTSNFDPFDLKLNEELTNKQSTKVSKTHIEEPDGIGEFSAPINEISEDEINKARQRADFEMKKKAAIEAQQRYREAMRESEIKATDTQETEKEPFIPSYIKNDPHISTYSEPTQNPVVVDFTEEEAELIKEELKISRTMLNPTLEFTKHEEPEIYQAPKTAKEPEDELGFELETEPDEDMPDELIAFDSESDDDESSDFDEEIPENEQNEDVKEYRKMFSFLDEEDKNEENDTPVQQETIPSEIIFDDDFIEESEQNPEASEDDDEDDIPFEYTPPVIPVQKKSEVPISEKKEEKPKERVDYSGYVFPSFDLLARGKVEEDPNQEMEKNQNAETLVDSLLQFNVRVSIKGIDRGPRITRYEIVPARGVKVSSVINLFNDIALKLGAEGIRMEAPIPGKSAIGVEIPNKHPSTVLLRDLVESDEFIRASSKTMCCLGKDVTGNPVFADISKMPHVLVAGATGMGKSVCINAILMSILYKARPDEVKFIMIDPKKVEFNGYNGIPHLLIPVVTDVKQAAGALMWAVEQMEKRYDMLEKLEVKKIDDYNAKVREDPTLGEPMPKIIIVIDELNDIMLQVRKPAEDLIMSIAQKARAAGIHLIIGTQRPSVDVITGVIKANIPTRISCKVASYNDSKTILEQAGAEKLLNNGDMLYVSAGAPKALRVQGAFVSDNEVIAIMKHIKSQAKGNIYDEQALEDINRAAQRCSKGKGGGDDDFDDEDSGENIGILNDQQFLDAVDLAIKSGKISTSLIQRKISIGYGKAAKFIDYMEEMGIVSEPNGQKPRDVLLTKDEWHDMLARRSLD